jgi:glycosyltransferase involved in cell wall biosynthesis
MPKSHSPTLSIVVPLHNEAAGIDQFHTSLVSVLETCAVSYEIIYCNDGSTDDTQSKIRSLADQTTGISIIALTRNFGKEVATTAGIEHARGAAIMMIDADGQHPVELIPDFLTAWRDGSMVVTGVRTANKNEGIVKKYGSKLFYAALRRLSSSEVVAGATDFRLIDQSVQKEFLRLSERRRITRGLIDWLGYRQCYIPFVARERLSGLSTYSLGKLAKLAIDSFVSLSNTPLYVTALLGIIVLPISVVLGVFMTLEMSIGDPLGLHITGGAFVLIVILFLVGCLLMSQGILGLYLSHIHAETQNRPLYIVDGAQSTHQTNPRSETHEKHN